MWLAVASGWCALLGMGSTEPLMMCRHTLTCLATRSNPTRLRAAQRLQQTLLQRLRQHFR